MPTNVVTPLYRPGQDITGRVVTAPVVGGTFVSAQSAGFQSGPEITTTTLASQFDGGNIQVATAAAGSKPDGVAKWDAAVGDAVPLLSGHGFVVPMIAGGTFAAGQEVEVGANGRPVVLASGRPAGKAFSAGTSGNVAYVRIYG